MTFEIIDSQVHIWANSTPERPWPDRHQPHRAIPITAESLIEEMTAVGVNKAILVPPSWEGERNDICIAAAKKYPQHFAVMGRLDPQDDQSKEFIQKWNRENGMLGLRFTFHRPSLQPLLTQGTVDWLWPLAEKLSIPIMMTCPFEIMHIIDRVAEHHPNLNLIIDHLGLLPGKKDKEAFERFQSVLNLSKRSNVAVKASCLPTYTNDGWPFHSLEPFIKEIYHSFGPQRMFWGSDLSRLTSTYSECVKHFTQELKWLNQDDLRWIMGQGLKTWLKWN
jgi:predicted TIM-barrel fold metal-dependent hydrolase